MLSSFSEARLDIEAGLLTFGFCILALEYVKRGVYIGWIGSYCPQHKLDRIENNSILFIRIKLEFRHPPV